MPNYGWRKQSKCNFESDRRFEFRRIRDIRVRAIEVLLYLILMDDQSLRVRCRDLPPKESNSMTVLQYRRSETAPFNIRSYSHVGSVSFLPWEFLPCHTWPCWVPSLLHSFPSFDSGWFLFIEPFIRVDWMRHRKWVPSKLKRRLEKAASELRLHYFLQYIVRLQKCWFVLLIPFQKLV